MFSLLRRATSPRGVRALINVAAIAALVWATILTVGLVRAWGVADDLRSDRAAACERGNLVRGEIAQVSKTLRHLVLLSIRNAPPVASMSYQQRVTYEGFKEEAVRLKVAIERLSPVSCPKE